MPGLDDLEEMPESDAIQSSNYGHSSKPSLGGNQFTGGVIPSLDNIGGSRSSNRRFASKPTNNNDVSSVYRPGMH